MTRPTSTKEELITRLSSEAETNKGDRYTQVIRKQDADGDYEVHEYYTPSGEIGYQIIMYETKNKVEYGKSVSHGPEASNRTWDWLEVSEFTE